MQEIKLAEVMDRYNLDKRVLAKSLFPGNKYPREALERILKGIGRLNSDQISRLSLITGGPMSALFTGEGWAIQYIKPLYAFNCKGFRAEYILQTGVVKVYDIDSLFHAAVFSDPKDPVLLVPLIEYISEQRDKYINSKIKTI